MSSSEASNLTEEFAISYPSSLTPAAGFSYLTPLEMDSELVGRTWLWLVNLPDVWKHNPADQMLLIINRMIFLKHTEKRCESLKAKLRNMDPKQPAIDPPALKQAWKYLESIDSFMKGARNMVLDWLNSNELNVREWIAENDKAGFLDNIADKRQRTETSQREGRSERRSESSQCGAIRSTSQGSHPPSASGSQRTRSSTPSEGRQASGERHASPNVSTRHSGTKQHGDGHRGHQ
jgi:hypothetical protein